MEPLLVIIALVFIIALIALIANNVELSEHCHQLEMRLWDAEHERRRNDD